MGIAEGQEPQAQFGRRQAIKKGIVAAGAAGLVWSAPRVEGLTLRPDYASAQSGPSQAQFGTGAPFVQTPQTASPCGTPGSFVGNTFLIVSSVGFSVNQFTGGAVVGVPTASAPLGAGTVNWSPINMTGAAFFDGPINEATITFSVMCA